MAKMRAKMGKTMPKISQDEVQIGQDDGEDGQVEAEVGPNALGREGANAGCVFLCFAPKIGPTRFDGVATLGATW